MRRWIAVVIFIIALWGLVLMPTMGTRTLLLGGAVWLFLLPARSELASYQFTQLAYRRLQDDVHEQKISVLAAIALVVKIWLFPLFLVYYLSYLFVAYTQVFQLHFSRFFLLIDEGFLLLVILLLWGVSMLVAEQEKDTYLISRASEPAWWCYYLLGGVVMLLSMRAVREHTAFLWWLAHLITLAVGIIVVLLTCMLLKDE
jgi:hypothetical protein